MDTKEIFEETGNLESEMKRLEKQIEKVNTQRLEMMEICPHEIVFKYTDNHPKLLMMDGTYLCPSCGKIMKCIKSKKIQESSFKNSKVIPLTTLSVIGTSNLHRMIRNEAYQNMHIYYNQSIATEELSSKMEEQIKLEEQRYENLVKSLRRNRK